MSNPVISIQNVAKSFHVGTGYVPVLKNISFDVLEGDFLIIFGPSGCGKSTLLHTILGLEEPSAGKIIFLGKNLYDGVIEDERSDFRKLHIGMIYQQPNWVKALNVIENIAFPLLLLGQDRNTSLVKATVVLETVEMTGWSKYLPSELSSGQQQRIALARALVTNPEVIIADEPTGNLDYESGQKIMEILSYLNIEKKKTIVMVTHDLEYLKFAKRAVRMFNGTVVGVYNETERGNLLEQIKSKRGSEDIENVPPLTVIPAAV